MEPIQLSFLGDSKKSGLSKADWLNEVVRMAGLFNGSPFFFSELRELVPIPLLSSWYRIAGSSLYNYGYRRTGKFRHSPIKSRKNGDDFEWKKGPLTDHNEKAIQSNLKKNQQCQYYKGDKND